jgi:hypothetical protein
VFIIPLSVIGVVLFLGFVLAPFPAERLAAEQVKAAARDKSIKPMIVGVARTIHVA